MECGRGNGSRQERRSTIWCERLISTNHWHSAIRNEPTAGSEIEELERVAFFTLVVLRDYLVWAACRHLAAGSGYRFAAILLPRRRKSAISLNMTNAASSLDDSYAQEVTFAKHGERPQPYIDRVTFSAMQHHESGAQSLHIELGCHAKVLRKSHFFGIFFWPMVRSLYSVYSL
ncbi:hypothetical protein shim_32310 [Shimia sp. SK013]|nr:hypothetical protein shim_32310 [Shimia sp. SK013]